MACLEDPPGGSEAGFTLIELMVVMVISLIIGSAALMAIQTGEGSSARISARQEAVQQAEVALARMTAETRQAVVVGLRTPTLLDLKTRVRVGGGPSRPRRIQYDCTQLSACTRRDCGDISESGSLLALPAACPVTVGVTETIRGLSQVSFGAELQGAAVAVPPAREAAGASPAFDFVSVLMRVRLDDPSSGRRYVGGMAPIEISGGVKLENVGTP